MTTTTKPTFDSLTPEQVNDLIADWVMKYGNLSTDNKYRDVPAFTQDSKAGIVQHPDTYIVAFDPYHSLDDCWKVEERMLREAMETDDAHSRLTKYEDKLGLILRDSNAYQSITWFAAYHAAAKQKCEAVLRAIGEVV